MNFNKNIYLDANLVFAGMKGGMDAIIQYAFNCKSFSTPNEAVDRCMWLKKQSKNYIKSVTDEVVKLENSKTK